MATLLVGTWTKTIDKQRVRDVLDGKIPYVDSGDDSHVDFKNPSVANPANYELQPTPQLDLDSYTKSEKS